MYGFRATGGVMKNQLAHWGLKGVCLALAATMIACGNSKQVSNIGTSTAAEEGEGGSFRLRAVIGIPGRPLTAYDISWVDETTQTYYLADRSNAGVDYFDARNNTYTTRVTGFVGADPRGNDFSGPNGVVTIPSQHELWAGDGPSGTPPRSTVKVIDLRTNTIAATINTDGERRTDEMAYDGRDHVLAAANNADDPPFLTLINTRTRAILRRITFDAALAARFGETSFSNGIEQSVYNPETGLFYLSIPELSGVYANGAVAVINPRTQEVTNLFRVHNCQPAGLALGPDNNLLVGCSDPSRTVVMSAEEGEIVREILDVGGSDEVWFNPGDNRYYTGSRNDPSGPKLGIIDADGNRFVTKLVTAFNSHSVAANRHNNRVFVPLTPPRAGHTDPNLCVDFGGHQFDGRGCIGVYWSADDGEGGDN
jgi:hypothetical protein